MPKIYIEGDYEITKYPSGSIVKALKNTHIPTDVSAKEPTIEEIQAQTLLNTEYLVAMAELTNI